MFSEMRSANVNYIGWVYMNENLNEKDTTAERVEGKDARWLCACELSQ